MARLWAQKVVRHTMQTIIYFIFAEKQHFGKESYLHMCYGKESYLNVFVNFSETRQESITIFYHKTQEKELVLYS